MVGCESGAVDTARKQGTVNVTVLFHFLQISGLPLSHHLSEESTQEMEALIAVLIKKFLLIGNTYGTGIAKAMHLEEKHSSALSWEIIPVSSNPFGNV